MLNKQKGNMYGFVTHTWNVIKGKCPHDCEYCYMKVFHQKELHIDEKELKTDLGKENFIFIGSSCDMFAEAVLDEWIRKTLHHAMQFDNTYLLQTKNPDRMADFFGVFPEKVILATTIETNRNTNAKCPSPKERAKDLAKFSGWKKMVTIEPVMDFDLDELVKIIKSIKPDWVNVGADSKNHNLPEPSKEKVLELIKELNKFTEVRNKDNLARLIK
jgi:DNA repair photolyase